MIYKILDQLQREDSFNTFSDNNLNKLSEDTQTLANFKTKILLFFTEIYQKSEENSFLSIECERMFYLIERIFEDFEDEEEVENDNDNIMSIYTDSLKKFVEGIEDESVKKYVEYIIG
ncbi:hypothetical protein GVAV_002314 [Gurleya vavrai]